MDSRIYFGTCENYDMELVEVKVEKLFSQIEVTKQLNSRSKVLLKPNLLSKSHPDKAITTHPEILRACIRACKKRGVPASQIVVADSAGGLYNPKQTKSLYQGCGLTAVVEAEGAVLYTECQWEKVPCSGKVAQEFSILKPVLEADFILNLPKWKSHVMTGMTAGCKNMFGCVPGLDKSQWHTRFPDREPFGDMLMDLYQLIPPSFTLLDGVLAMEGDGPGSGTPRHLGLLVASEDTLHLDLAVASMMGLNPMVVPYLKAGMLRGLCAEAVDTSQILGDVELFQPITHWKLPKSYENGAVGSTSFVAMLPKVIQPMGKKIESALAPRPVVLEDLCIGCKKCSEICSKDAIVFQKDKAKIKRKDCIRCFCCHEVCPVKAIDVVKSALFSK